MDHNAGLTAFLDNLVGYPLLTMQIRNPRSSAKLSADFDTPSIGGLV